MITTESQDLLDRGLITTAHKTAIENVSGHSGIITDAFYLRRSRTQDARRTNEAFSVITSEGAQVQLFSKSMYKIHQKKPI
jgi:hypothetical protein